MNDAAKSILVDVLKNRSINRHIFHKFINDHLRQGYMANIGNYTNLIQRRIEQPNRYTLYYRFNDDGLLVELAYCYDDVPIELKYFEECIDFDKNPDDLIRLLLEIIW